MHAFKLAGVYQSPPHAVKLAFTSQECHDLKTLTYFKPKQTPDKCSLDCLHFSGQSFRQGGPTLALHCTVPGDYIKLQGDWKSNAYKWLLDQSLC